MQMIRIADYPQLQWIACNRPGNPLIDEKDALALYEAYWRFVDLDTMEERERQLLRQLAKDYRDGALYVCNGALGQGRRVMP